MDLTCDAASQDALIDAWLANNGGAFAVDDCSGNDIVWTHNYPIPNTAGLIYNRANFSFINSTGSFGGPQSLFNGVDDLGGSSFHARRDVANEDWGIAYSLGSQVYISRIGIERRNDCCTERGNGGVVQILLNDIVAVSYTHLTLPTIYSV